MDYSMNDMKILATLLKHRATNQMRSMTIFDLVECMDLSETKIRRTVRLLVKDELVSNGYMKRTAKTYFISDKGLELLYKLRFDGKENAAQPIDESGYTVEFENKQ